MQDVQHTSSGSLQSPPQSQPFGSNSSLGASGSGQDFVLFEDPSSTSAPWAVGSPPAPSDLVASQQQPFNPIRPAFTDKPSFTEYRAPPGPASLGGGAAGESPFSSPASRLEDDFGGPSSVGSHGSGTLSLETGIPNRKRQRGNDSRGHASSTSLSSLANAMATSRHMALSSSGTGHRPQRHSIHADVGANPSQSSRIPGLSQTTAPWGDDWSLADTSPRNPPSGSFGPPIGSLSLGGQGQGGDEELFPTLFPELTMSGAQSGDLQNFFNSDSSNTDDANPMSSRDMAANASAPGFPKQPRPAQSDPTPAQEELARRQVQQDLEGIDQRALRGPLRALVQGANVQPGQQIHQPVSDAQAKISQAEMDSALQAAVQSFVAEADANRGLLASARAPGSGTNSQGGSSAPAAGGSALSQDQRNLLFPGSAPSPSSSPSQESREPPPVSEAQYGPQQRPAPLPRRRSNSFDASYLPAQRPWFSQSPPQTTSVNGTGTGTGTGAGIQAAPGGFGMGTGTGWTGFPTNNFNAFDLGGQKASQLLAQGKPKRRPLTRDRSGLTVSPHETFLDHQGMSGSLDAAGIEWNGNLFATNPQEFIQAMNGTGGLQKAAREALMAAGQATTPKAETKPQLLRGDTVRPTAEQQQAQSESARVPGSLPNVELAVRPMQAGSSASSGMSIFSPGSSDTTPDTEDEDERPFRIPRDNAPPPLDYDAILKQQQQQQQRGGTWPFAARNTLPPGANSHHNLHVPRFLASSSSSSESDEEMSGGSASRGFPPFNAQQSGPPMDFSMAPMPPATGPQQLGRGRGLQGGYGYMPGSAESGLQIDPTQLGPASSRSRSSGAPVPDMSSVGGSSASGLESANGQMSQEDERMSPSIRSMAQVVSPPHASMQEGPANGVGGPAFHGKPAYGGLPVPDPTFGRGKFASTFNAATSQPGRRGSETSTSSEGTGSQWESSEGEAPDAAALDSDDNDSDYQQTRPSSSGRGRRGGAAGRGGRGRRGGVSGRGAGAAVARKRGGAPVVRNKRPSGVALDQSSGAEDAGRSTLTNGASAPSEAAVPPMYGGTGTGTGAGAASSSSSGGGGGAAHIGGLNTGVGGASQYGNLTICEYVSPLNGLRCGTEFHRPYDLARHRETIHAKEEASLLRQGKLAREQCRVLYVEVDPEKSQATQEWRCDGRNGCGSVFSRKDALQRHRRLRNH